MWTSLLLALLFAGPARAGIGLSIGSVQADAWQAQGLSVTLADAAAGAYHLKLSAAQLALPAGMGDWRAIRLDCPALTLADDGYRCAALQVRADTPYGSQHLQGELHFVDADRWSLRLTGLRLAGGRWQVDASSDGDWRVALQGQGVAIDQLAALAGGAGLPHWGWRGRLGVQATVRGRGGQPTRLEAAWDLKDGAWASADGLQAAEGLRSRWRLKARHDGKAWRGELQGDWEGGQVYSDPVFVMLDKHPLHLSAGLRLPDTGNSLQLTGLTLRLGELLAVDGDADLPLAAPLRGSVQLKAALPDLAGLYPVLLQPLAFGGPLGELDITGRANVQLDWQDGGPTRVALDLAGVHLDDRGGRFGLAGLAGELRWLAEGESPPSGLQWQGGHLFRVDFGASRADLGLAGDRVWLQRPLVLPMLDGVLRVPAFNAAGLGGESPSWHTALRAEALSLPVLTQALDWPVLSGALSVEIPAVRYADSVMALDGELVAQAFDGTVRVTGLELREPLGPAPLFSAEASLRGLDLERLTRVFGFGSITGRLDGDVRGLQLVGWEPVAFEAELRTPPGDDSRHRISQRAVENLTALGNNGAVALSGTFLRFFESFSYDRLRLEVVLSGQVAALDGIAHPQGGYYLVKGAGLPRIDVIGRNRRVAWRDLIGRLRRIRLEGAQVR